MWWFTDLGWMMGPWLIAGGLILGASILLYDGAPDFPDAGRVWSIVERHGVTHLGMSPTAIRGLMRAGEEPVRTHDRSSLFVLGSTGEPWNPEPWWWYFGVVGERRAPLVNYSGGTEISGGIVGCTTWMPLKPTSFSCPVPGMAADVCDESGRSIRGAVGELVVRKPWPGMTRGFWRAPEHYLATYWRRFPDVWVHGDWARIDDDGFWYIDGRSDDTLKVAGKRVGPAEVESAATAHPAVLEAAVIGVPHELKGEAVIVFAVLRPGGDPARSRDLRLDRALVPGRVRLRPRGDRGRVRRRFAARAESRADDALLRGRLLDAHPVHDADGAHRHLRLRRRVLAAGLSSRAVARHDPEDTADRGRVDRPVCDCLVAPVVGVQPRVQRASGPRGGAARPADRLPRRGRRRLPRPGQRLGAWAVVVRGAAHGDQGVDPRFVAADLGRAAAIADDFPVAEHRRGGRPHGGLRPGRLSDGAGRWDGAHGGELRYPPRAPGDPHPGAAAPRRMAGIQPPADDPHRGRGGCLPRATVRLEGRRDRGGDRAGARPEHLQLHLPARRPAAALAAATVPRGRHALRPRDGRRAHPVPVLCGDLRHDHRHRERPVADLTVARRAVRPRLGHEQLSGPRIDLLGRARPVRALGREQMGHRSALSAPGRERAEGEPRLGGADLQRRGGAPEPRQPVLDAAAPRAPGRARTRPRRLRGRAAPRAPAGGVVSDVALRAHAALHRARGAAVTPCGDRATKRLLPRTRRNVHDQA